VVQAMALSTRLGLGAKLGSGDQVFPWVTRDDVVNAFMFILGNESLAGPVNVVGREKVTNEEFADTFARVLGRPRLLTIPASVVRILGEIGDEVLRGMWMVPEKLQAAGYDWVDPDLEPALRRMLR
jgi:NAD dependent epimerase/dehydratase family enzyme